MKATVQDAEALERRIKNARQVLDYEKGRLASELATTQAKIAEAEAEAQGILLGAKAEAERMVVEAQMRLDDAAARFGSADEKAKAIIDAARENAATIEMGGNKELQDLVLGLSFLRRETDTLTEERVALKADVDALTLRKQELEASLEAMRKRFKIVARGLE